MIRPSDVEVGAPGLMATILAILLAPLRGRDPRDVLLRRWEKRDDS